MTPLDAARAGATPQQPKLLEDAEQLLNALASGVASVSVKSTREEKPWRVIKSYPDNCRGASSMKMRLYEKREFIKELVADVGVSVRVVPGGFGPELGAGVEGTLGTVESTGTDLMIEVPAFSRAEYHIEVRELRDQYFIHMNDIAMKLPFSLRKGLVFEPRIVGVSRCQ